MNWFTDFLKDPLTTIFGQDEPVKEYVETYNYEEVKAGILHLRNTLVDGNPSVGKEDYNQEFRDIRLKPSMTPEDIYEQLEGLYDRLSENDLLTEDEQSLSRGVMIDAMSGTIINRIGENDYNQNLMDAIRFDQQLHHPNLRIVHRSADNE